MTTPSNGRPDGTRPASFTVLETEFPGWRIWRPPSGRSWWATRRGSTWAVPRTVAADTEDELRAELLAAGARSAAVREARPEPGLGLASCVFLADIPGGLSASLLTCLSSSGLLVPGAIKTTPAAGLILHQQNRDSRQAVGYQTRNGPGAEKQTAQSNPAVGPLVVTV
jgi:hypothetical protein